MVELGNIFYFIYLIISIFICLGLYFLLRNKNKNKQKKVLLIILFCNLGLHFLKLLFEPYRSGLPESIRKVTFENICAVSTLIFPFIYISKNKTLNMYMYFIGIMGGVGAVVYPTEAFGNSPFSFNTIRFYICHSILYIVPLLSAIFGIIRLDYKKAWLMPIYFILIEIIILINEIILSKIGFVDSSIEEFFDRDIRNSSFVFGPLSSFDTIASSLLVFVPKIFMTDLWGITSSGILYWPVIWLIIPCFVYIPFVYLIITIPFTYKDIFGKEKKYGIL